MEFTPDQPPPSPPTPDSGVPPLLSTTAQPPGTAPAANKPKPTLWKRITASLTAVAAACAKFFAQFKLFFLLILKYGGLFLKTGGTMLLSMWVYAQAWGWEFAAGFVILIFIHEMGHVLMAKLFRLRVSAPMFIPFMGALILLKERPYNAWVEACVGIGGPLLGGLASLGCVAIFAVSNNPLFLALAYSGCFLNLFNLMPISPLDGGRIVTALSPWMWIAGYAIMACYAIWRPTLLLFIIILAGLPRLISLFRAKTAEQQRYFEVTTPQRFTMAAMYFGLALVLALGMELTHITLDSAAK